MLAIPLSMGTKRQRIINGILPHSLLPGISQWLDGRPKKYLIGPGDFATKNATTHVNIVERIIVTINEPR